MASVTPTVNDVLFGRGSICAGHPGNRRFRSLVALRKEEFTSTSKRVKKRAIVADIMREIQSLNPAGRFLTEDPDYKATAGGGDPPPEGIHPTILKKAWVRVDDDRAMAKVHHCLREKYDRPASAAQSAERAAEPGSAQVPRGGEATSAASTSAAGNDGGHRANLSFSPFANGAGSGRAAAAAAASPKVAEGGDRLPRWPPGKVPHYSQTKPIASGTDGGSFAFGGSSASGSSYLGGGSKKGAGDEATLAASAPAAEKPGGKRASETADPSESLFANDAGNGIRAQSPRRLPEKMPHYAESKPMALDGDEGSVDFGDSCTTNAGPTGRQGEWQSFLQNFCADGNHNRTNPRGSALEQEAMAAMAVGRSSGGSSSRGCLDAKLDLLGGGPSIDLEEIGSESEFSGSLDFAGAPRPPSAAVSLLDWIKLAAEVHSSTSYVECAVDLAWIIARCLRRIANCDAEADLRSIHPENLTISVDPSNRTLVRDVSFNFSTLVGGGAETASDTHAVSAALGSILLEIFSYGRSRSQTTKPPAKRQRSTSSTGSGRSTEYKETRKLLLDSGMPASIRRLVCDLIDAENNPCSVEGALWDLSCMRCKPKSFLFGRSCRDEALQDTGLFGRTSGQMFGREDEMSALISAKDRISMHSRNKSQSSSFLCEVMFLEGYAGSGKSFLVESLTRACNEEQWFVLGCKFDEGNHVDIVSAFNDFFGRWKGVSSDSDLQSPLMPSFHRISRAISKTLDADGILQLCEVIPNLEGMFPLLALPRRKSWSQEGITSMEKVGSGDKRRLHLFRLLLQSLCSVGCPVLLTLDDIQWAGSFSLEFFADFLEYVRGTTGSSIDAWTRQGGLLIVGAYRVNEAENNEDLMMAINRIKQSGRAETLSVSELAAAGINKLVSAKLCLPWRYTKELSALVQNKTRGNVFYIIQFLRAVIQNKMLHYSVASRRWKWDIDTIEMQAISDGVAELLLASFSKLPPRLMQTMKIISCLGYQVEESTIDALDYQNKVLSFDMKDELPNAVQESLLEKAGPIYQFTHDILRQTIYDLIPLNSRKLLHKLIGNHLLNTSSGSSRELHRIAVDQVNKSCGCGQLDANERSRFALQNAEAARASIAESNFEQARSYIDMGIQLLEPQHWTTQYDLSLDLYEMSASVSCMCGDISAMSPALDQILLNAKSFDDSLKASSLLVKLLASSSKTVDAVSNCIVILQNLGEDFPADSDISLPLALSELNSVMQQTLRNSITKRKFNSLPPMTNRTKIHAMKFLNLACAYSFMSRPMLIPFLSSRMLRLTMEYGFCDDSIVGLALIGYSLFTFKEDIRTGSHIVNVSEALISDSPNEHVLRARLCSEMVAFHIYTLPAQEVMSIFPETYNSAMLAGDVENAVTVRYSYCACGFFVGAEDLRTLSKHTALVVKEAKRYQQSTTLYCTMAYYNTIFHLSGGANPEIETKTFDELTEIGKATDSLFLVWQSFICKLAELFFMQDYLTVIQLCQAVPSPEHKRLLHSYRMFYEGLACLSLARDTRQSKWKNIGEQCVADMKKFAVICPFNFNSKYRLLRAELSYSEGNLYAAEVFYESSIESAKKQGFLNDEAVAYELYGVFLVESKRANKGLVQLRSALEKYKEWGAMRKVRDLQLFVDSVEAARSRRMDS